LIFICRAEHGEARLQISMKIQIIRRITALLIVFFAAFGCLSAQSRAVLDWPEFRQRILTDHPLARRADMFRDMAAAELLRSRGGFDVKSYGMFDSKNFDGKNYFRHGEAGLKLPTWYGLEFKTTYLVADGDFLNSSDRLPSDGQGTFGFNWTLGQGLMIDERRADLFASKIGLRMGDAERAGLLNDLMLDGAKVYWSWVVADQQMLVYAEALRQAQIRHVALRERFQLGESPAIDTLETFIQVQNRTVDLNFAQVDRQTALLALRNFWWLDAQVNSPFDSLQVGPELGVVAAAYRVLTQDSTQAITQIALQQHPDLQYYKAKQDQLDVERRLKNEKRKPVFDVNYNILGNSWQFFPTMGAEGGGIGVLGRDIKWGVSFSYPLQNRKARGDLQMTRIKMSQNDMFIRQKARDIEVKIQQYATDYNNYSAQLALYRDLTNNYRALLDAELTRFGLGESSVFLVNTREQRWLDARIKYLKLVSEYRKTEAGLRWAAGVL
jgi:outer membrane protein TolC